LHHVSGTPTWAVGGLYAASAATLLGVFWNARSARRLAVAEHKQQRNLKMMDVALTAAVDFIAASEQAARASQDIPNDFAAHDSAKSSGQDGVYEQYRSRLEESQEARRSAWSDAETALVALRLLVPIVADDARSYLDACQAADSTPKNAAERRRLRSAIETGVTTGFGVRR